MRKNLVRMQHADRRKLLLSHAVNIFALKGYNFTTRELAKNADVSVTLLHKYFDTKNGIIKAVLDEIFEYGFNAEILAIVDNKSYTLSEKLTYFYKNYSVQTYNGLWLKVYMNCALLNPKINLEYIDKVKTNFIIPLCYDVRKEFLSSELLKSLPEICEREIEFYWNLHGSLFYWGIRKNVFNSKISVNSEGKINDAISLFLAGAREIYPRIISEEFKIK